MGGAGQPGAPRAAQPQGAQGRGEGRLAGVPDDEDLEDDYLDDDPGTSRGAALLLAGLAVVLLAVLPALFLIRDAARDPVYSGLNALAVPSWANLAHEDQSSGNAFCFGTCALRERVVQSARSTAETDAAFQGALRRAGWERLTGAPCPSARSGVYTCWQHDQYVLDLWTRDANCATSQYGGAQPGPSLVVPSNAIDAVPSAAPSVAPSRAGPATAACPVSQVTVKVGNRADPLWHK
jgi:hypothetical protein